MIRGSESHRGKSPSLGAGIAGRKETEFLKPIDEAIYKDDERVAGP